MKIVSDVIQTVMALPEWWGVISCIFLFAALLHARKLVALILKGIVMVVRYYVKTFLGHSPTEIAAYIAVCFLGGYIIYQFRADVSDWMQRQEPPVYLHQFDNMPLDAVTTVFENRISEVNAPAIAIQTIGRSRMLADSLHIPVLWIYQAALPECGLNPFTIRRDRIAAGWIQFTALGLSGITPSRSLKQVIDYCETENIEEIMNLTDGYMRHHCSGKTIARPVDVYLAVFCPAKIGHPEGSVLYSGHTNPSYYLNKGLDGWRLYDNGRILRQEKNCDGIITVGELALILEAKKNSLLGRL